MENIVLEKNGKIIDKSSSVFGENTLMCQNNHTFKLCKNDLILGKWCPECKDVLEDIIKSLDLDYQKNILINSFNYKFVLQGERNFVIFNDIELRKDMIENAISNNYNVIVVDDFENQNLKMEIWDSIKQNKRISLFTKEDKHFDNSFHNCTITENLGNERGEEGSIIKKAPEPFPTDKKVMKGYIRVSTIMQVQDGFSLEAQENKIYREIEKYNGFLHSIYIDRGISGGSIEKRLALERMMSSLKEGDWVLVNSVSRLARKTKDLLSIVETIERKKCHLLILDLNLDITSPSGKLILTLMGSQAQFEREITSERVKGVMEHLKKTGSLRTKPPFGWKMNIDRSTGASIHVRDEEEQEIIKKIRILRSKYNNISITKFSEKLNEENLEPPRSSKKWYHKTLKSIMTREGIK